MWWMIFIALVIIYITKISYKNINYWRDRGVVYIKALPLLGSLPQKEFRSKTIIEQLTIMYNKDPNTKCIGFHQFTNPILVLRDTELIKQVTVKDFDSFMNHRIGFTEDSDTLFGKNLMSLKGQEWKDMRSTLSPAFTGSKMRAMYALITECSEQFVDYFLADTSKDENGIITVEMKDIFTRYANDVIGTAAFGIKCNSLKEKENEFYMAGKKATTFNYLAILKIVGFSIVPRLMKLAKATLIDRKVSKFFRNLIYTTLKTREEQGIVRPDMIHLLMEARKGRLRHETSANEESEFSVVEESSIGKKVDGKTELTDDDIAAQAFLFFFAGYDTASTLMGFMAYELVLHPEIQKRLQDEIDMACPEGKINYEAVLKMKYLDMVVSETLRKWPPGFLVERLCNKPYTIENSDDSGRSVLVEEGISVWIPVYCLHHDPNYFPEPERFDPERFSAENKNNIAPFTYLPFGSGPRNCIGSRFALLEIKVLFAHLLRKFDLTVVEKTQIPLKLSKKHFNMTTEKGIWVGFKARN